MSNKGRRSLLDFDSFEGKTDTQPVPNAGVSDTYKLSESVNMNSNTEQLNVTDKVTNTNAESSESSHIGTELLQAFEKKTKRETVEDTHTRQTYLVRNDLIKRLDKLAKNKARGFKTMLVNHAIEKVLEELEDRGKK